MTQPDDVYRPPEADVAAAGERLTKDEWRYAAKVFGIAAIVLAVWIGMVLTLQTHLALRAFSAEGRVCGIVAVSAMREVARIKVALAMSIALILVVHRRLKTNTPPPSRGLFLPVLLLGPLVTPLVGILATATSIFHVVFVYDSPFELAWQSILHTFMVQDGFIGMLMSAASSLVLAAIAPDLLRFSNRFYGWPILKCFIASFVVGLVHLLVGYLLFPIVYGDELQGFP